MNFSDKIERNALDTVCVIRTEKEMMAREESNSNLWNLECENFLKKGNNIYSIPVRDLKIGESFYTKQCRLVAYRVS